MFFLTRTRPPPRRSAGRRRGPVHNDSLYLKHRARLQLPLTINLVIATLWTVKVMMPSSRRVDNPSLERLRKLRGGKGQSVGASRDGRRLCFTSRQKVPSRRGSAKSEREAEHNGPRRWLIARAKYLSLSLSLSSPETRVAISTSPARPILDQSFLSFSFFSAPPPTPSGNRRPYPREYINL
jgi:hypothetical protein